MFKIFSYIFSILNIITIVHAINNGLPQLPPIVHNPNSNTIPAPSNNLVPFNAPALRNTDFPPAPHISASFGENSLNSMQMVPGAPNKMNMPASLNSMSAPNLPLAPEVGREDELPVISPSQPNTQVQAELNNSSPCEETIVRVLNRLLSEQASSINAGSISSAAPSGGPQIIPLPNGMLVETYIFIPNENLRTP